MTEAIPETTLAAPAAAPATPGDANQRLLAALATRLDDTLRALVPADRPIALLDSPLTGNVGDSLIWLGALTHLARRGLRPCYTCTNRTFDPSVLARRIGTGTILMSGGGNFGDLYPDHQEFREAVVTRFPRNRVVQLPQSIHFASHEALARARRVLDRHDDLTLLARDRSSLAMARENFRVPVVLCPDMSFALGPMARPCPPTHDVVWLARADKEARETPAPPPPGVLRFDWVSDEPTLTIRFGQRLMVVLAHRPSLRPVLAGLHTRTSVALARARLARGCRQLSAGRVVVTTRLHGHLLALLLGIPHVLLDNSYGKVRGAYDTWTHASPLVQVAEHQGDALVRALALARGAPPD
jgi:pyruvyl transferase EpsO